VAAVTERQITRLVRPFPSAVIKANPGGGNRGSYVAHPVVEQRILHVLGPVDFEVVEIIRGDTRDGKLTNVVVGCLARLSAEIDGRRVTVVEVGDCENPGNWPHDGARLKDAASDAYKRCAMRLGVGLHLWADKDFHLYEALRKQEELAPGEAS
jgi:hypothetical protein